MSRLTSLLCSASIAFLLCCECIFAASVKDFGAAGDGRTDDTAAIARAVASGSTELEFPAGVYRIQKTIDIELDKVGFASVTGRGGATLVMSGSGPAIRFVGTHQGTADPGSVKENVWLRQRMPRICGLEIVGDHADADGLQAEGTMQLTIDGVLIRKCRHAIHLTGRNRNLLVTNCHLYENRGCGILYDHVNLHQSNIVGCHISYCAGGGVVIRGGEVRNVHIGTCDIESNMTPDGEPSANVLIDCREGSTDEVAITGCTLQHNSKSPGSANIRVLGRGITSSRLDTPTQEGHITITGNVMSDVMVNVHLVDARGVTITGNTFWEGFESDIVMENCQAVVIGPNDMDRNPRYVVNGHWSEDRGGIVMTNCSDCKLNGLLIKGVWKKTSAVQLVACRRVTLNDLSILDCDGYGLELKRCVKCRVSGCTVDDERIGDDRRSNKSLLVVAGSDNTFNDNIFSGGVESLEGGQTPTSTPTTP